MKITGKDCSSLPGRLLLVASAAVVVAAVIGANAGGEALVLAGLAGQRAATPAYTVVSTQTFTPAGGATRQVATHTLYQRANGLFKRVSSHAERGGAAGRVATGIGLKGVGVFTLDEGRGRLVFVGPLEDDLPPDVGAALRSDSRYARAEAVAGFETIVLREREGDGEFYTETYHAPALAGLPLKQVRVTAAGTEVTEATSVVAGEPSHALFAEWRLPADYSRYERLIAEAAGRGAGPAAGVMRGQLGRMKEAKR